MNHTLHLLILGVLMSCSSFAQTAEQVRKYFEVRAWDSVITCGKAVIEQHKDEYDTYMSVGRAYNSKYMYKEAIPYLEKAKSLIEAPLWVNAWAMCELGPAYYAMDQKKLSSENLAACIKLNATKNSQNTALRYTWIFGFDPFFNSWRVNETRNFKIHFQDTFQHEQYAKSHQWAFDTLSALFNCTVPQKIDFYVWENDSDLMAKKMMKPLAFSRPEFTITHTSMSHSLAHEIMHHILFYAFPDQKRNELITEGTCVYFDLSRRDNLMKLKNSKSGSTINIRDCWKHPEKFEEGIIYPLGGELVKRIYEKFGKEKFILLMNDQSLENAERVFGEQIDSLITRLEADIKN